ncbi:DegT/DnrJ/EryC1/StrS family aminotransferase [Actinomycetospora sp.]|jgi:dTDP-4-amino-4,6-dideoxygalactose transaminase|uniref:DegT/DnrJ/EryC1/StrS family aminotransferase n=1 Tax=Actinomycetospora sp. TaxID=1872135 RepID=UPI002F3EACAD
MSRPAPAAPAVPFTDLGAMTRDVRDDVDAAWKELLTESDFVGGAPVERFEGEWARYCGTTEAVGVANGTDALVLALRALGIGGGDEVVVPANTFVATAEAVVLAGARPRFADVDPGTLLLTADGLAAAITPRTAAVIVVHLYGQTADMDALDAVAARAGLPVIEDAAQAHGATWAGRRAGSMGRLGCFSFYPGKNLGAFGDAGAVVTTDPRLADTLRSLRNHGRAGGHHERHDLVGTNSRMDTLQAAVLSAKLARLDGWTGARRAIADRYREAAPGTGAVRLVRVDSRAAPVHHLAVAMTDDRDGLRAFLAQRGIATAVHYPVPCHLQAAFTRFADGPLPVAEAAAARIVSLPLFPHMTDDQVAAVCGAVAGWDRGRGDGAR